MQCLPATPGSAGNERVCGAFASVDCGPIHLGRRTAGGRLSLRGMRQSTAEISTSWYFGRGPSYSWIVPHVSDPRYAGRRQSKEKFGERALGQTPEEASSGDRYCKLFSFFIFVRLTQAALNFSRLTDQNVFDSVLKFSGRVIGGLREPLGGWDLSIFQRIADR